EETTASAKIAARAAERMSDGMDLFLPLPEEPRGLNHAPCDMLHMTAALRDRGTTPANRGEAKAGDRRRIAPDRWRALGIGNQAVPDHQPLELAGRNFDFSLEYISGAPQGADRGFIRRMRTCDERSVIGRCLADQCLEHAKKF